MRVSFLFLYTSSQSDCFSMPLILLMYICQGLPLSLELQGCHYAFCLIKVSRECEVSRVVTLVKIWENVGGNVTLFVNVSHEIHSSLFSSIFRPPSQHEEVNRRRRRTNILLASITIIFFVGWSPMVIFSFIYDFASHLLPEKTAMQQFAYAITLLFGMLTPIANPILYSLLNENFQSAIR